MKKRSTITTSLLLITLIAASVLNLLIDSSSAYAVSATPQIVPAIVYPPDANTDYKKLLAVYSILEQMRLERNARLLEAQSDWSKNEGKWYTYAVRPQSLGDNVFRRLQRPLLLEQNRLKESILREYEKKNIPLKDGFYDWRGISAEEQDRIYKRIFGDRHILKHRTTKATSILLDKLRAIDFNSLTSELPVDPTEDFTSYTEDDPLNHLTQTADRSSFAAMSGNETTSLYKDYDADHFTDFEHLVKVMIDSHGGYSLSQQGLCIYGTALEHFHAWTPKFGLACSWGDDTRSLLAIERYPWTTPSDASIKLSEDVVYYLTMEKSGTSWTIQIDTGSYGGVNVDTLSHTLNEDYSMRYILAPNAKVADDADNITGYLEELDLQESASDISNTPSTLDLDTVYSLEALAPSSTYYANGNVPSNPIEDGECTFTVTNSSGAAVDIDVKATNFTGGVGWTLTSGVPGENTVRMTTYYSGQDPASGVVVTTGDQAFISALADSATLKWDFKLETGTFTDGVQKTSTITLTATLT